MRSTNLFTSGLSALALGALASAASATVLTFDFGGNDGLSIPQAYGDRVGDPMFPPPPGWSYGAAGGITPNINVAYTISNTRLGGINPTRVFGDLSNVAYIDRNANPGGILEIILFADEGFFARLHSFDLASVFNSVTMAGENLPARSIQVRNGQGVPLYQLDFNAALTDPFSPLSTYTPGLPGPGPLYPGRKTLTFNPPIQAQVLIIHLDFTQLLTIGGNKSDRIGIDNIVFSQIPTPGAAGLLIGAGLILARRRRS